jgi:hypothetical protein
MDFPHLEARFFLFTLGRDGAENWHIVSFPGPFCILRYRDNSPVIRYVLNILICIVLCLKNTRALKESIYYKVDIILLFRDQANI